MVLAVVREDEIECARVERCYCVGKGFQIVEGGHLWTQILLLHIGLVEYNYGGSGVDVLRRRCGT